VSGPGGAPAAWVDIHYRRLPDRETVFRQRVVHREPGVVVTLLPSADLPRPVRVNGRAVLEPGSPVVWFTYPGLWHDIGRFHTPDGRLTGFYANVLTPVEMSGERWRTTDLCLDVWLGADGALELLDEAELAGAEERGWLDAVTARRARAEAAGLVEAARAGTWPPAHVHEWTLARASAVHPHESDP
jgi:predicted RNA-binding protein associated with RNAse of E/G family